MIIQYIDVKYSYIKTHSKIKNEFSYIYEDKYLNDDIFVLNSNLIRQSFLRKKHLIPWWFVANSKNISIYKEFSNKWDIFNVYPIKYTKKIYNSRLNQEKFFYLFYKKLLKSKKYSELNFKYFKNNFKYLIKWRNKQRFTRLYSFYKVFRQIKKFWKRGFFATYNGHIFSIGRRFMRLKKSFVFFRNNVKYFYKNHFILINSLIKIITKKKVLDQYSKSKLLVYYAYLLYLSFIIKFEFTKLKKARLNKKGPFYSYFMFKKKPVRIISFFFKQMKHSLFNNISVKETSINNRYDYKLLQYYYYYNNPLNNKDYFKFYYLYYLNIYQLLLLKMDTNNFYVNTYLTLFSTFKPNVSNIIKINKARFWKKFRKFKNKRRYIFRQAPYGKHVRALFTKKYPNFVFKKPIKKFQKKNRRHWQKNKKMNKINKI